MQGRIFGQVSSPIPPAPIFERKVTNYDIQLSISGLFIRRRIGRRKDKGMNRRLLERNILQFLRSWMSIRAAAVRLIDGGH